MSHSLFKYFVVVCFQYIVSAPNQAEVMEGMFIPWCADCNSDVLLQAVGVVGAVIMPHNLYLHSALVKVSWLKLSRFSLLV